VELEDRDRRDLLRDLHAGCCPDYDLLGHAAENRWQLSSTP
jgi:hypothetical protein